MITREELNGITKENLNEIFDYKDGNLYRKTSKNSSMNIGDEAGFKCNEYIYVSIMNDQYSIHRIIWIYHYGNIPYGLQIDHINRICNDNNIDNLRLVTNQENQFNIDHKGYRRSNNKWRASIRVSGKAIHLGYFEHEEDARQAYLDAKEIHHTIKDRI